LSGVFFRTRNPRNTRACQKCKQAQGKHRTL
jgi:hypothetical protein